MSTSVSILKEISHIYIYIYIYTIHPPDGDKCEGWVARWVAGRVAGWVARVGRQGGLTGWVANTHYKYSILNTILHTE